MKAQIVVHYGEIGTKGNNRNIFESCLERNILSALHSVQVLAIRKQNQRFLVDVADADLGRALDRVSETFGVSWCAAVDSVELSYDRISERVIELLGSRATVPVTFRITARRANKDFQMSSTDLTRRLGADVVEALKLKVDLRSPEVNLRVDVLSDRAIIYTKKVMGPGGLPVGVTGRVIHLLSGGIDSPVAAWSMMKRGCSVLYMHFFMAPNASTVLDSKIIRIVKRLSRFGGRSMITLLPFSAYQVAAAGFPEKYEPVIFRAFMRRVAERLAERFGAQAVTSGDNLGQVASQTLYNLRSIDHGAELPVLRPLVALNKTEIINMARSIGTYELSVEEYTDCCVMISRHPSTRTSPEVIDSYLYQLDFELLMQKLIRDGSVVTYDPESDNLACLPLTRYFESVVATEDSDAQRAVLHAGD